MIKIAPHKGTVAMDCLVRVFRKSTPPYSEITPTLCPKELRLPRNVCPTIDKSLRESFLKNKLINNK